MKVILLVVLAVASISALPAIKKEFPALIVGGTEATRGEFPSIVQIKILNHYCAGTIVNANYIVTAANCAHFDASNYTIVAGEHNLNTNEGSEQIRTVTQIKIYSYYNFKTLANDIALMKLNSPLIWNKNVYVALMSESNPTGNVVVAGWGWLSEDGPSPTVLMKVTVPMVTLASCRALYGEGVILPGMICAGTSGKDSCYRDNGGPLYSGSSILGGIVSWGKGCVYPNYPRVYTSVASYIAWIHNNAV